MANKVYFELFDNIYKFMDVIGKRPNNGKFGTASREKGDWSGTKTYEEAVEQFSNGLPETAERLKKSLGHFRANANINTPRNRPNNHYYGYSPNIPAAIIGLPKSMRRIEKHPQKTKTIGILWDCCQNCGYEADTLRKAGETVLQLVFALEIRGYRVNLDGIPFNGNCDDNREVITIINLKKYGQPMDILKLSFPVTSPAMFRRFGFKWAETIPEFSGDKVVGYGHTMGKDRLLTLVSQNGINTKSMYCIDVKDCEDAEFDPLTVAKNLGIVI
jgi:hypothetical protein